MLEDTTTAPSESSAIDVAEFAARLQEAARKLSQTEGTDWRSLVADGFGRAYRENDIVGLAAMVRVVVGFLDAQGNFEGAVGEINQALALAHNNPDVVALLHAMRAPFEIILGRPTAALESIRTAESLAKSAADGEILRNTRRLCAFSRIRLLAAENLPPGHVENLMTSMPGDVLDGHALMLMSVYVPYRTALGDIAGVRPWLRTFRIASRAAHHEFRQGDALAFEQLLSLESTNPAPLDDMLVTKWNVLARARIRIARVHQALLHGRLDDADADVRVIETVWQRAALRWDPDVDPFLAVLNARRGVQVRTLTPPEDRVELTVLEGLFACAEAVAIAGSQADAARWSNWMNSRLPAEIETAIAWPSSRYRIQALLALRAGDARRARTWFNHAIEWTARAGYQVEHTVSLVQFAEFQEHFSSEAQAAVFRRTRLDAWAWLRARGIDPAPFAYVVAHSSAGRSHELLNPGLTPRESEVLQLLAQGLKYKEIAVELGVAWPTVQSLAHRCYEKLEVSGRVKAVQVARELGIL